MHDLTMTVINDGNGSICSATYERRLEIARIRTPGSRKKEWHTLVSRADDWTRHNHSVAAGIKDRFQAVQEIEDYYQKHIQELAGV